MKLITIKTPQFQPDITGSPINDYADEEPVIIADPESDEPQITAIIESGYESISIDLKAVLEWVKENRADLLK